MIRLPCHGHRFANRWLSFDFISEFGEGWVVYNPVMLDYRTALISYGINTIIATGLVVFLWLQIRRRIQGIEFWLIANLATLIATLLLAFRESTPEFLSIIVANGLYYVAAICLYIGLKRFAGQRVQFWLDAIFLSVSVLIHAYFTYIQPSLMARQIIFASFGLVYALRSAWVSFRDLVGPMRLYGNIFGISALLYSLASVYRIVMIFLFPPTDNLFDSSASATTVMAYEIFQTSQSMIIFLFINRQLIGDLERDNAERKQAEAALRVANAELETLIRVSPLPIVMMDSSGMVQLWNVAAIQVFGWHASEAVGRSSPIIHPERQDEFAGLLDAVRQGNTCTDIETVCQNKAGDLIDVSVSLSPIRAEDGTVTGSMAIIADITERKQAEQRLQQTRTLLAQQQREVAIVDERQRMARNLHDSVSQSLHSLVLFSETLEMVIAKDNRERSLYLLKRMQESARQSVKEMRLLLYEMQDVETVSPGLVQRIETRLSMVERHTGINVRFIHDALDKNLPAEWSDNLYWITMESLNNSIKYAQAQNLQITLRCPGERVELEIRDDGVGFVPSAVEVGGHGLKNLRTRAAILGGELNIETGTGRGTRVYFYGTRPEAATHAGEQSP